MNDGKLKGIIRRLSWGLLVALALFFAMMRLRWLRNAVFGALALLAIPFLLLLGWLAPDLYIDLL